MQPSRPFDKEPSSTRYAVLGVAAGLSVLAAGAAVGGVVARVTADDAPATSVTPVVTVADTTTDQPDDEGDSSVYTDTQEVPVAPDFVPSADPPATTSRQS